MLTIPLTDLLNIDVPIIQAGMSVFTSADLIAAVSNAGVLGSLGCWKRPADSVRSEIEKIHELTDKPFAVNHVVANLDEELFKITLASKPAVISLALAAPADLVDRAHDAGSIVMHQVITVGQAAEAAEHGVDVIIAQGGESGGYGSEVATMPLVPQVVDAVHPLPVVASGAIADGRGLDAALVLGASGVNIGTRFLASAESPIHPEWKQMLVEANSEDVIKFDSLNDIAPGTLGYGTIVRSLRTDFIDEWNARRSDAVADAERKWAQRRNQATSTNSW